MSIIGGLFYYLSDNKLALKKFFRSTLSGKEDKSLEKEIALNEGQKSFLNGIVIAWFVIIGMFIVLPVIVLTIAFLR